uniref:WSN domain-containing protein n=1 Tax=Caenorhabditis tropicalis TaxID=1561998 RepID=A0A1I7UPF2_9PELO
MRTILSLLIAFAAIITAPARVVNGITVYNGILDSSIPIDSIISELMGVGSFKLKDLNSFDKTGVDNAVGKITGAKISFESV